MTEVPVRKAGERFYRPELDALRFFAFLAVLIHHGPDGGRGFWTIHAAGAFGLSMFFVLSAYLITELLLRERDKTQTVSWKLFFVRRALRIWPLYYAAIGLALVIAHIPPRHFFYNRIAILVMALFVANWSSLAAGLGPLISHLWSISIEEQFYLVWPPIMKFGGKRLALAASVAFALGTAVWLIVFSRRGWMLWYDTPVEFLFFAVGAAIAIWSHGKQPLRLKAGVRAGIAMAGLVMLLLAAYYGRVAMSEIPGIGRLFVRYGGGAIGCAALFIAAMGMTRIPKALLYLGKISCGLYVFHLGIMLLTIRITAPLRLAALPPVNMFVVDAIALALTIALASISFEWFEERFIKLKERFAVIQSRPA